MHFGAAGAGRSRGLALMRAPAPSFVSRRFHFCLARHVYSAASAAAITATAAFRPSTGFYCIECVGSSLVRVSESE